MQDPTLLHDGEYGLFEGSSDDAVVFDSYRRDGTWSPTLVSLLTDQLLSSGGSFIDVGANIGLVSVPVAERTPTRCHAFEPEPKNCALLRRNVARHGLQQRIQVHPVALDRHTGRVQLALSPDNSGDHRLLDESHAPPGPPPDSCITVTATTLDEALERAPLKPPIVVKIDSQGAELRVLTGGRRLLPRIDFLILEYWPAGLVRLGDDANELLSLLRSQFSHGAILEQQQPPRALEPIEAMLDNLSWIPTDGSDEGFFDLLVARSPQLRTA
ncbi:MAG: FkbM family methyltransferase [Myxococcales bacterium]|nr:FkbM family methyltransferase [Myxococcales bacterium]